MRTPDDGEPDRPPGPGLQASSPPGRFTNVVELERVDSTNRYALDRAREGADEGLVVVAAFQDEGRGRRGRSWSAPPGGALLCSVLFRPTLGADDLHLVPCALSLACVAALERFGAADVSLKWPNDLVAVGGKLGGVLTELETSSRATPAVVVGVGINLVFPEGFVLAGLAPGGLSPVTLEDCCGRRVAPAALLAEVLRALEPRYASLGRPAGRRALAEEYRARLETLGQIVAVSTPEGEVRGRASGIDRAGRLLVDTGKGETAIAVGDVIHLRRSDDR